MSFEIEVIGLADAINLQKTAESLGMQTPPAPSTPTVSQPTVVVAPEEDLQVVDDSQDLPGQPLAEPASDNVGDEDEFDIDQLVEGDVGEQIIDVKAAVVKDKRLFKSHTPTYRQINPGSRVSGADALAIPTISSDEALEVIDRLKEEGFKPTRDQADAIRLLLEADGLYPTSDVSQKFIDEAGDLTNHLVMPNGRVLAQSVPALKEPTVGSIISGEEATALLARKRASLDTVNIPAIHSGIWFKVKSPKLTDLHNLQSRFATVREQLGYQTSGTSLTCDSALRNLVFMDWFFELTVGTSLKDSSEESIRRNMTSLDINMIAANLSSVLYPSGHVVERGCSSNPINCTHVERDILRTSKAIHIDGSRLTDGQLAHMQTMLHSNHVKTEEQMQAYRSGFSKTMLREVTVEEGVKVTFTSPSIEAYSNTANEWVGRIRSMSESIISNMTTDEANRHLLESSRLELLSKYCPWVESIEVSGCVVNEGLGIQKVLAQLSESEDTVEAFTKAVTQYMADCTVAVMGVYDYKCPKCKGSQLPVGNGALSAIIPIDAINTFFTLARLKTTHYLQSVSDY